MNPTRALIEAAVRHLSNCRCGGTGLYSRNPYLVEPFDCDKCSELRAAISSAKAAEEGVETRWIVEYFWMDAWCFYGSSKDEANARIGYTQLCGKKAFSDKSIRIIRRDTYTTVIEVREKEGL